MIAGGARTKWTVLELLTWTTEYFEKADIERPRLNAELLLGEVLRLERIMLYARFNQVVGEEDRERFREFVKRRAARVPLQYLLGRAEFYGRTFQVTPAVMIPRQETELLVDKCLQKLPGSGAGRLCCDVGTGSGVIAVTLAAERPELRVIATDSSAEALEVATRNAETHALAGQLTFLHGHLAEPVADALAAGEGRAALLVSNPPYVPTGQIQALEPEVRDYEPRSALDGGSDGLHVITELIPQAALLLEDGGWLVLELGEGQAEAVMGIAARTARFREDSFELEQDGSGHQRVFAAQTLPAGEDDAYA